MLYGNNNNSNLRPSALSSSLYLYTHPHLLTILLLFRGWSAGWKKKGWTKKKSTKQKRNYFNTQIVATIFPQAEQHARLRHAITCARSFFTSARKPGNPLRSGRPSSIYTVRVSLAIRHRSTMQIRAISLWIIAAYRVIRAPFREQRILVLLKPGNFIVNIII